MGVRKNESVFEDSINAAIKGWTGGPLLISNNGFNVIV